MPISRNVARRNRVVGSQRVRPYGLGVVDFRIASFVIDRQMMSTMVEGRGVMQETECITGVGENFHGGGRLGRCSGKMSAYWTVAGFVAVLGEYNMWGNWKRDEHSMACSWTGFWRKGKRSRSNELHCHV